MYHGHAQRKPSQLAREAAIGDLPDSIATLGHPATKRLRMSASTASLNSLGTLNENSIDGEEVVFEDSEFGTDDGMEEDEEDERALDDGARKDLLRWLAQGPR
jgi:hypothetical protein